MFYIEKNDERDDILVEYKTGEIIKRKSKKQCKNIHNHYLGLNWVYIKKFTFQSCDTN